jgi:hypothetical protein
MYVCGGREEVGRSTQNKRKKKKTSEHDDTVVSHFDFL